MTLPTAGWYDDPDDDSVRRWWDGEDWSEQTRDRAESIAPGWYDDPQAPGAQRWWDGTGWTDASQPTAPVAVAAPVAAAPGPEPVTAPAPASVLIPAGWYDDPQDAAFARWWDGQAWTDQRTAKVAAAAAAAPEPAAALPAPVPVGGGRREARLASGTAGAAGAAGVATAVAVASAPASMAPAQDAPTGGSRRSTPAEGPGGSTSRRRWLLIAAAVAGVAMLVLGGLVVRGKLAESQLAEPASTPVEKEWALAGASLGSTLAGRGVAPGQAETVCSGGYELLAVTSVLPDELKGADPDRSRALYVASCVDAYTNPAAAPTGSAPSSPPAASPTTTTSAA